MIRTATSSLTTPRGGATPLPRRAKPLFLLFRSNPPGGNQHLAGLDERGCARGRCRSGRSKASRGRADAERGRGGGGRVGGGGGSGGSRRKQASMHIFAELRAAPGPRRPPAQDTPLLKSTAELSALCKLASSVEAKRKSLHDMFPLLAVRGGRRAARNPPHDGPIPATRDASYINNISSNIPFVNKQKSDYRQLSGLAGP